MECEEGWTPMTIKDPDGEEHKYHTKRNRIDDHMLGIELQMLLVSGADTSNAYHQESHDLTAKHVAVLDIFISYTYKPDYLQDYPECVTNWQLHRVHTQKQLVNEQSFDFKVIQMPLILDGGNVVKAIVNNKPCFIMCDKVLQENNLNYEDFQIWWKNWWQDNFDGTEMEFVLLPWEGHETNPIGHADGMVRYIEEGRVLLTNYDDFDKVYKDYHGCLFKDKLEEVGFKVDSLSFLDKFNYQEDKMFRLLFKHSWCYINYLHIGNKILVPRLGYEILDKEALRQIEAAFNREKHIADVQLIDVDMTPIVEDMNENKNSGGALNCLTWTIKI